MRMNNRRLIANLQYAITLLRKLTFFGFDFSSYSEEVDFVWLFLRIPLDIAGRTNAEVDLTDCIVLLLNPDEVILKTLMSLTGVLSVLSFSIDLILILESDGILRIEGVTLDIYFLPIQD